MKTIIIILIALVSIGANAQTYYQTPNGIGLQIAKGTKAVTIVLLYDVNRMDIIEDEQLPIKDHKVLEGMTPQELRMKGYHVEVYYLDEVTLTEKPKELKGPDLKPLNPPTHTSKGWRQKDAERIKTHR
jgi:hypothetical protein